MDLSVESLFTVLGEKDEDPVIRIGVYRRSLPNEHEYDRVHLMIKSDGEQRGWLMTPHEAEMIATGLMMAVDRSKKEGWYDG